jgi:hypothetical protein
MPLQGFLSAVRRSAYSIQSIEKRRIRHRLVVQREETLRVWIISLSHSTVETSVN